MGKSPKENLTRLKHQNKGLKIEPEVHIIEKYFQVVLGYLTMTNRGRGL